ncbi:hypothetical protein E2C01_090661 [Portunus trituberculatus]|uniref:Uncharacterized protein n=1 Tax=Portunus trituberculatus TaxID=210409 RepID=A0A5B7JFB2_PORTR|nr:hypothetical protein [Portunus trituberculatus]
MADSEGSSEQDDVSFLRTDIRELLLYDVCIKGTATMISVVFCASYWNSLRKKAPFFSFSYK